MSVDVVLATRNPSKIVQIRAMLDGLSINLQSMDDAGVVGEAVEDGTTLFSNAKKKAIFANTQTHKWVIAEDTGFFIHALDGAPGIRAARWAGPGLTTEEIMHFTLDKLHEVPIGRRTAIFETVAVIISPGGGRGVMMGRVHGTILMEPRTKPQDNMPYSSIFVPDGQTKTWAEMSTDEENAISHRGQAFRAVRDYFAGF